ncbi:MAG TPA: hypothetical protein ENK43_17295 [Planctomycetes bacterium]|nr:hypothetical protein [Planctomycetota bacterium]
MSRKALLISALMVGALAVSVAAFLLRGDSKEVSRGTKLRSSGDQEATTIGEGAKPGALEERVEPSPSRNEVDSIVGEVLPSAEHDKLSLLGPRFYDSADELLCQLVGALSSLRSVSAGKVHDNGRTAPSVREIRIEGSLGDWAFTERLMGLRHTVLLTGRDVRLEYVWLRKEDADIVPWYAHVILEFLDGAHAGEKLLARMALDGRVVRISPYIWNGRSYGKPNDWPIGALPKDSGSLRDAFVENAPDASFKSFVNW